MPLTVRPAILSLVLLAFGCVPAAPPPPPPPPAAPPAAVAPAAAPREWSPGDMARLNTFGGHVLLFADPTAITRLAEFRAAGDAVGEKNLSDSGRIVFARLKVEVRVIKRLGRAGEDDLYEVRIASTYPSPWWAEDRSAARRDGLYLALGSNLVPPDFFDEPPGPAGKKDNPFRQNP